MSELAKKQPAPERGGRSVTILVVADLLNVARCAASTRFYFDLIQDLVDRDREGFRKYGQNLETHDGRDTLADLYQEITDAMQYARKDLEEGVIEGRGEDRISVIYAELCRIARTILEIKEARDESRD